MCVNVKGGGRRLLPNVAASHRVPCKTVRAMLRAFTLSLLFIQSTALRFWTSKT